MTKKQYQYLQFVKDFRKKNGYQPSLQVIAKHFGKGITTIYETLQKIGLNYACYRKVDFRKYL